MEARRDWTAIPEGILASIAESLGLIDLLSFRGVCHSWNRASSTASAEIEALPDHEPWLLVYGENNPQCTLVTEAIREYTITIPELVGAICIGSNHGWLLVFHEAEGSMFFFCPFSRARIDLPVPGQFPRRVISDHVAIFSSPPTSQHCVACIISKSNASRVELYVIHRGATAWTEYQLEVEASPYKIFGAVYHNGAFYFFYNASSFVYFSIENRIPLLRGIRIAQGPAAAALPITVWPIRTIEICNRLLLGLGYRNVHSICGTTMSRQGFQMLLPFRYPMNAEVPGRHGLKAVWVQPRFHQIGQNQSW